MKTLSERITFVLDYFSDKTLSFGCVVVFEEDRYTVSADYVTEESPNMCEYSGTIYGSMMGYDNSSFEIIGHPVMISDVLERLRKDCTFDWGYDIDRHLPLQEKLIRKWSFPFDQSLNEILGGDIEENWKTIVPREVTIATEDDLNMPPIIEYTLGRLKDANAQSLLEFLEGLLPLSERIRPVTEGFLPESVKTKI